MSSSIRGKVLFSPEAVPVDVELDEDPAGRELKLMNLLTREMKRRQAAEQRCSERMVEAAAAVS